MRVLRFLRGGINQTRICRCVLRLEFLHGLEVRGVSDNFGKLFQLLELIQFRSSLFVFSNSSAHNKFSFWTWSERTPRSKDRQRQSLSCHSERSREWSGWGSRDIDGKARKLSEWAMSESNPVVNPQAAPRGPSTSSGGQWLRRDRKSVV